MSQKENTPLYRFVKASERPIPKKYTGKVIIICGNTTSEGVMLNGEYYNGLLNQWVPATFPVADEVYWNEEIPYPSTDADLLKELTALATEFNPYVWPLNSRGEEIVQRVGQNAPNSRKHTKEIEKLVSFAIIAIQTERQRTVKPTPESKGTQERGFRWVDFVCAEDEKDLPEYGQHVIIQYGLGDVELGNRSMIKELFENGWQNIKWSYIPSHTDFSPQQKASVSTETAEVRKSAKQILQDKLSPYVVFMADGDITILRHGLNAGKIVEAMEEYASSRSLKDRDMHLNMQYYMEHCQSNGYVTPQDWLKEHKHF